MVRQQRETGSQPSQPLKQVAFVVYPLNAVEEKIKK